MPKSGTMFLVVGPSGSGKDSLIAAAHERLAHFGHFLFPKRVITRPNAADREHHIMQGLEEFEMAEANSAFALSWHAYGHGYGVPGQVSRDMEEGHNVVVNVSRAIVPTARMYFDPLVVLHVTVPFELAIQRLQARGREDEWEMARRMKRHEQDTPEGPDVIEIDNSGAFDEAVEEFVIALLAHS